MPRGYEGPQRTDLFEGPYAQTAENLYIGIPPEIVERIHAGRVRAFNDLIGVGSQVTQIFIGMHADPDRSRSVFVANPFERMALAKGEMPSIGFEPSIFPDAESASVEARAIRYNLLQDDSIRRVVCVNTAWPHQAVERWVDTAVNRKPNKGRVGIIGLGQIGQNALNAMISNVTTLRRCGVESPLKAINVHEDPHPEFRGRLLEARHIRNRSGIRINEFSAEETETFFRESDLVLFIVSRSVPSQEIRDPSVDVRMSQFESNLHELRRYLHTAESAGFNGTFIIVSDPPEHLATAIHTELSERLTAGIEVDRILGNHQIVAEAGMINLARAEYVIGSMEKKRPGTDMAETFEQHGYVFGPHGRGLIVANDVRKGRFNPQLSDEVSQETSVQNYRVRQAGKLPYTAPGTNLALAVLNLLEGRSLPISIGIDGVVYGARSKLHDIGAFELDPFPDADPELRARAQDSYNLIKATTTAASGRDDLNHTIPLRPTAFWANGVITGDTLMTKIHPTCSGRDIIAWNANIVPVHNFAMQQGRLYVPPENKELSTLITDAMKVLGDRFNFRIVNEDDGRGTPSSTSDELVSTKAITEGAGIVTIRRMQNPNRFDPSLYKSRYPLYLQVDVAIDNPSAIEIITKLQNEGAISLGFTPRTHTGPAMVHFGIIGERVAIDREFPTLPLRSSMTGFEPAMRHLDHWRKSFEEIRATILKGFGKSTDDDQNGYVALSFRDTAVAKGKEIVERDPVLNKLLNEGGLYKEASTMYEHVVDVIETANHLVAILGIEKEIDQDMLRRVAALHDLGKTIYLRLTHFVNAKKLQDQHCTEGLRALNESELGDPSSRWKYGKFIKQLTSGEKIELPETLIPYARFMNFDTGEIAKDTTIAEHILTTSGIETSEKQLYDNLMRFFKLTDIFDTADLYTLVTELADNLSDYGRLNNLDDILKYLGYKEAYAIKRYGSNETTVEAIKRKFNNLRMAVISLYDNHKTDRK